MDDADRADLLIETTTQAAVAEVASRAYGTGKSTGICIDCGSHIQLMRLRVIPWAQRCVLCQADEDRRAAQYGR